MGFEFLATAAFLVAGATSAGILTELVVRRADAVSRRRGE
jgi:hypothetical protein